MSSNAGRPWGRTGAPYAPEAPWKEAAKHLRLVVTRYLAGREPLRIVEEAMVMLRAVAPVAGDVRRPSDPLIAPRGGISDAQLRRFRELARDGWISDLRVIFGSDGISIDGFVSMVPLPAKLTMSKIATEDAASTMIFAIEANLEGRKPRRKKR